MKNKLIILSIAALAVLPAMAVNDATVLTPGTLYEITQKQAKAIGKLAVENAALKKEVSELRSQLLYVQTKPIGELQRRVILLEQKMTHVVNLLKLKQENGK